VLLISRGIAPPAIVGYDSNEIGAIADITGHKLAIDAFVTYGGSDVIGVIGGIEDGAVTCPV